LKGKKQTLYLIGSLLNTAVRCESAVRQSASACNAGYRADRTVSLDVHGSAVQCFGRFKLCSAYPAEVIADRRDIDIAGRPLHVAGLETRPCMVAGLEPRPIKVAGVRDQCTSQ